MMDLVRDLVAEIYPWETRVAIIEEEQLVEVFWTDKKENIGNIYKAKVKDVLPGLSCAFVDIGLSKNAFLYFGDAVNANGLGKKSPNLILKSGQEMMVQVSKEAFSEKGARVTGYLTIPGHFLVLLPYQSGISVSRKISDNNKRDKLCNLIEGLLPDNIGVIIRTACSRAAEEDIINEFNYLLQEWQNIRARYKSSKAPSLIYEDIDTLERALREYMDSNIRNVSINNLRLKDKIDKFVQARGLAYKFNIKYETGDLFEKYGLNREIYKALKRKVWLKSGGYLIFDQTEAMTIIDVNSGKFTGRDNFEKTVCKINYEAAIEIPRQLRLRSMGGIILIDFIDMTNKDNREKIIELFKQEIGKDKAHTRVFDLTNLGILEMTRKKSRYGLTDIFTDECTNCKGHGRTINLIALTGDIKRKMANCSYLQEKTLICEAHPTVIDIITQDKDDLEFIRKNTNKELKLISNDNLNRLEYKIYSI